MMKRTVSMIIAIALIAVFMVPFFSVSVKAQTNPEYKVPYVEYTSDMTLNSNEVLYFGNYTSDGITTYYGLTLNNNVEAVCCGSWPGYQAIVVAQTSSTNWSIRVWYSSDMITYHSYSIYQNAYTLSGYSGYSYVTTSKTNGFRNLPSKYTAFSTVQAAMDASIPELDYTPEPDPDPDPDPSIVVPGFGPSFTFSLPAGYAAIIVQSGTTHTVTLNTIFKEKSALVPSSLSNGQWWWGNSQSYGFIEYAVVGDEFFAGDGDFSLIPWVRKNQMFGTRQSINGYYNISYTSNDSDAVSILNPYYNYYDSLTNNDISITVPNPHRIMILKLDSYFDNSGSAPLVKCSVTARYDLGGDGQYYLLDNNGRPVNAIQTVTLPSGGSSDTENSQTSVLDKLVSGIEQFFTGSWQHIRNLTESISGFPELMGQIFAGLPSEVVSVIVSFFSILIVMGIVKALL